MSDLLLTTLGITWQIVPELYAFTNPYDLDLFRHHPERDRLNELRVNYNLQGVNQIWIVTTKGTKTQESLELLWRWHAFIAIQNRPRLNVWQVAGTRDLASEHECRRMQEAIFRIVLHAWEKKGADGVVLSLAGGRKTMSSDMHQAAAFFGTKALVHVVDNPEHSQAMRNMGPEKFTGPLPVSLKDAATPLITGSFETNPLLQVQDMSQGLALESSIFPIPSLESNDCTCEISNDSDRNLVQEIERRTRQAEVLLSNYVQSMRHTHGPSNFLAFRLLRRQNLDMLHNIRLGIQADKADMEKAWLRRLPKAELHCHLGGIADSDELLEIARANSKELCAYQEQLGPWLNSWRRKLDREGGKKACRNLKVKDLRTAVSNVPEPLCTASFLLMFEQRPDDLDRLIFGSCRKEEVFCGQGFSTYERFGDLQGSGLLQNEASIRAACRILARKAERHNVRYLELRCSPANYTRGGLSAEQVVWCIQDEMQRAFSGRVCLLFIASRHGKIERVQEHVLLAKNILEHSSGDNVPLCGFDLAGGEASKRAEAMRQMLMPMLEKCLHMTIHAGETQNVQSIWEAVYHLNAERIGHGLTLKQNPALLDKFRDRDIAIEMCPSSNMQIVGFQDAFLPSTSYLPVYPLKGYLDQGLRVTVNTDNPGISRTNMTNELHRAARLSPNGLSLWEICSLVRNGFRASFASRDVRTRLLRQAEEEVIDLIQQGIWP